MRVCLRFPSSAVATLGRALAYRTPQGLGITQMLYVWRRNVGAERLGVGNWGCWPVLRVGHPPQPTLPPDQRVPGTSAPIPCSLLLRCPWSRNAGLAVQGTIHAGHSR